MWTRWPGCTRSQIISAPDPRRSPAKTGPAAGQVRFSSCRAPHFLQTKKGPDLPLGRSGPFGGRGWIRTTEALSSRFTVCPHWPLGNTPLFCFCHPAVSAGDLFILPQRPGFVNRFFRIFWKLFSAGRRLAAVCRAAPGLDRLLIVSSRWGFVNGQFPFFSLCGQECGSVTNFFIPLVFFQAVFYNSDIGTGGGKGLLCAGPAFAKRPLADPSDPSGWTFCPKAAALRPQTTAQRTFRADLRAAVRPNL